MQLIQNHLHHWDASLPKIPVTVDRLTLAKRRWRGTAADGQEFGFDLEHHLHDGDIFWQTDSAIYGLEQTPEPVLEVTLTAEPSTAAKLGWMIGNLHFQLGIHANTVLVPDDPALRQLFEREHIPFTPSENVFRPLSGGHHH